jgi:non-specific serine/threonine protein kinase
VLDACAELAGRVLDACPGVRLLATSREPLRIAGERQLRVGPLAAPDAGADSSPDDLAGYPAVALFVARAQAVAPDFALTPENAAAVALVCARLDGIPLALELAAARVGVLSVAQIAARLDDCLRLLTGGSRAGPTRQQTLRAALDWSHDLLAPAQRAAFRRLAVFPGSFDLEAALAVWDDGAPDAPADLDALADLVQRSLVVAEPPPADRGPSRPGAPRYRYRLLEPVRQYAAERLAASGEEAALPARHAAHFQAVAAGARARTRRRWRLPDSLLSDLEPDLDNLRAALRWLEQQGDIEGSLALGQVVWALWARRGLGGEGRAQAQALLARVPPDGPQHHLAALGWWVALFAHATGDYARARATGEAALAAWRALGDRQGVAQALSHLGVYVRELGDDARAQALLEEGLALYRALGEPPETADTLIRLGQVFQDRGDLGRAGACYEESRALLEAAGERSVRLPHHLGSVALDEGRHAAAGDWFRESLALQHELGLREWVHSSLADLASLAAAEGDPARALRLGGAADRAAEEVGATLPPTERQRLDRWLARARQALDAGAADSAWAGGRALTVAEAVAEALAAPARHPPRAPQPAALTAPGAPG